MTRACAALLVVAGLAGAARAKGGAFAVREVAFEVQREPDGKKYPAQVKESYQLDREGKLRYAAYFGGMPTNMNHNDSVEWKAGDAGKSLVDLVARLVNDPASGVKNWPDSAGQPDLGVYTHRPLTPKRLPQH